MSTTAKKPAAKSSPRTVSDAAREALERRKERKAAGLIPVEVTPEQIATAGVLRERDHLEGCPVPLAQDGPARVEAFAETVIAPGPEIRGLSVGAGDTVVVVRCHGCGGIRYLGDFAGLSPSEAREALVDRELERLAGVEADLEDDQLDNTL